MSRGSQRESQRGSRRGREERREEVEATGAADTELEAAATTGAAKRKLQQHQA